MKFHISMKTPDAVGHAIENAVASSHVGPMIDVDAIEERKAELEELCNKWFKYGESVIIEIDTDAKTATVLRRGG